MAKLSFDTEQIAVPCPKCGVKASRRIGEMRRSRELHCEACGVDFAVDLSQFDQGVRRVDKAINDAFKGFGKR